MALYLPENYDPRMDVRTTQQAIKYIRDTFQKEFGKEMNLERISAPLFVPRSSGLNDNLSGKERPVRFDILGIPGEDVEVVQSLAKWKRMALYEYGFQPGNRGAQGPGKALPAREIHLSLRPRRHLEPHWDAH